MLWQVSAKVRRVGAIGVFYTKTFTVSSEKLESVKDDWFAYFSDLWELNHFNMIVPF